MNHLLEKPAPTSQLRNRRTTTTWLTSVLCSLALVAALLLSSNAFAQGITGSITGNVTDSTGAAIPGATVTITQITTNSVHTTTTSDVGSFTVTQLPPGDYTVKIDKAAFKSYQQQKLTLAIDQTAQINAALEVGSSGETVMVTGAPPVIQTEDSSVGLVIDSQAIQNTPLNGRLSIIGLIALAPGVQGSGAQDQLATRGVTAAIGTGGRNAYGSLGSTLDGVTNQEVTLQRGEGEVPSIDAISQFKVLSTGAPAEFNQPAQIIVVSASGGNQLHGEALEYNRSKGTSAKSYFNGASARPPYQRNEYGGNLSGPIFIPHVYDGRNRSFFFAAFEGFHLTQSYALSSQQPTLLERQGNFSELLAGGACNSTTTSTIIKSPTTGLPYAGNIITDPLSAVDQQLLTILYPKPTTSGCGTNTFEQVQELSQSTRFSLRLDHKISDKDQIRFTWLRAFYGPNATQGSDSLQGGNAQDGEHNSNFIVGYTHTFSPTLLIDTYASFFHLPIYRTPQNYKTDFASIIPGLGAELIEGAPQISITNITAVSESGSKDLEQVAQINTAVTKVLAKHTIKAGFSYLYDNHWNDAAQTPARGSYSFTGTYSGNALADFLLGDPASTQKPTPNNYITRNISAQYGLFVQDDWKPTPKLTINAGLRYDLQWFRPSPYNTNSLYVPSLKEVVVFASAYPSNVIPSLQAAVPTVLAPSVGLPTNIFSYLGQDKNNVAPRLGFAYEALHNTVIRGAFGIYFNLLPASYVGTGAFNNLPFTGAQTFTNATGTPAFTMANPFSATGAFSSNPSVYAQAKTTTPYTEEYNLTVEHQFAHEIDLRIGYVGQHNLKQNNYGGPGNYNPNLNLPAQPVLTTSTVQSTYNVQPFSAINYLLAPIFHSNENSLQVGLHKQYSHGLTVGAEYQWTRVLGTENLENPSGINPSDSYGPIAGITPQVLTLNYSYLLPFGKGKTFLSNAGDLIDKLVSGWQFSGITDIQSGQPFSVTYTAPGSYTDPVTKLKYVGLVSGRASVVPGQPLYPKVQSKAEWFNPAAFTAPTNAAGIAGAAYGNSGYDMLRGPKFQDWDMSLQKNTKFHDKYNVQLRADAFNTFNHPNFATPNAAISNTSTVGTITGISGTPAYEQRTVEFAAKFTF
jgi:outer membrane receptor protein involved in Fe transport